MKSGIRQVILNVINIKEGKIKLLWWSAYILWGINIQAKAGKINGSSLDEILEWRRAFRTERTVNMKSLRQKSWNTKDQYCLL